MADDVSGNLGHFESKIVYQLGSRVLRAYRSSCVQWAYLWTWLHRALVYIGPAVYSGLTCEHDYTGHSCILVQLFTVGLPVNMTTRGTRVYWSSCEQWAYLWTWLHGALVYIGPAVYSGLTCEHDYTGHSCVLVQLCTVGLPVNMTTRGTRVYWSSCVQWAYLWTWLHRALVYIGPAVYSGLTCEHDYAGHSCVLVQLCTVGLTVNMTTQGTRVYWSSYVLWAYLWIWLHMALVCTGPTVYCVLTCGHDYAWHLCVLSSYVLWAYLWTWLHRALVCTGTVMYCGLTCGHDFTGHSCILVQLFTVGLPVNMTTQGTRVYWYSYVLWAYLWTWLHRALVCTGTYVYCGLTCGHAYCTGYSCVLVQASGVCVLGWSAGSSVDPALIVVAVQVKEGTSCISPAGCLTGL